jgi:diketogulonate reductase-like aldo/keto reductase
MTDTMNIRGHVVPRFMYGTAWKEDRTEALVTAAIAAGFRAIDTANQRKHYFEAGVGAALAAAYEAGRVERSDLFLQTKFTYQRGQDHRLPYDPGSPLHTQVAQSFASSLEHLKTDYIDAYVLHGPSAPFRLTPGDEEVWRAMEALVASGKTKLLGVSNVSLEQLEQLYALAEVKPAFVQNRCFARDGWGREVRAFCRAKDIVYQGFSLLTANGRELNHPDIGQIAERAGATVPQVVFKFALEVGMLPLTGTTDRAHMDEDLACSSVTLAPEDMKRIEGIATAS